MCVADAANWRNIELAGTNPTYRPLPYRCESHITSHSRQCNECIMWPMCDWTRLYCCNNTAPRLSRGVWPADVGHSVPGRGWWEQVAAAEICISDYSHCTYRSTNRCKQSGDRFELTNGRCLNEFRYSFWVYTENETENENENEIRSDSNIFWQIWTTNVYN